MRFLGIDPGSRKAGYGVIEVKGRQIKYIDSGVMAYDKVDNFIDRLGLIYNSCAELAEIYKPDEIAFETLIYVKSIPSLAKLSQARGAMIAAFMGTHQGKVFEYSPNLIKNSVTGHGHTGKEGVEKSLKMIFGGGIEFKRHDESDALAIAVCHSMLRNMPMSAKGHAGAGKGRTLKEAFKHLEK